VRPVATLSARVAVMSTSVSGRAAASRSLMSSQFRPSSRARGTVRSRMRTSAYFPRSFSPFNKNLRFPLESIVRASPSGVQLP
jgi:hypothetical protein